MRLERIPSIISDILLTNSLATDGYSSVHVFDDIVQSFSQPNRGDMPPLLVRMLSYINCLCSSVICLKLQIRV